MVSRGTAAVALRYGLAPVCVGIAVLLHVSPVGPLFPPMGLFIIGVVAAAWFGGIGPGVLAAFLSAISLPHLIAITYPLSVSYPLVAGVFDLPRFITLGLTGAAVGWGRTLYRRAESALRETERAEEALRRSEAALRLSEERYALAMEASEDGHFDTDLETDETFVSARLAEIYGFPRQARIVNRIEWVEQIPFHPDDRPVLADLLRRDWEDPTRDSYEFQYRIVPRPGETRWIHTRGVMTRDAQGRARRRVGVVADITEAKLAEEALRQSEERYALAVAGSDDGVWDVDFAARRVFISARARELAGMPPGPEIMPMEEWFASLPLHPDDVPRRAAAFQAHVAGQTPAYEGEFRLRQLDGVYRWRRLRGLCVRDANGAPRRMAGSISDIDARRRAEEALRSSEERYALALGASEEGHFDANLETGEIFVSARLNEIYGFPRQAKIANRAEFLNQIPFHPDDRHILDDIIRPDWVRPEWEDPTRDSYEYECRIIPRPGEIRWIHTRGKVTRDAAGRARRRTGVVADITARKLAEEALRLSEERYSLAMEASEEGHFDINLDTDELFTSERFNEIHGFPPGTKFGTRRAYLKQLRFYGNDRDTLYAAAKASLAKDAPERYQFEYRILGPSGEMRWIRMSGKVTRDAEGRARRRTGIVADITEARLAADELRESEARFRALTQLSSDWYWEQDEHLRFAYMSDHATALGGYTEDSSLGKTRWQLEGLAPLSTSWAEHQAVLAARQPFRDLELRRTMPDGSIKYLSISGAPIFDERGRFKGYRGVGCNITERKLAADTVHESEARFRSLTELSSDWYWRQDEQLRFTYTSRQPEETTAYPSEWVIGKTRWELPGITPLSFTWPEHQAALAARQPFRDLEYARTGLDGTRYVSISGAPIFDDEGVFRGYQGIGRDITDRKRIEEALRQSEERYALAVAGSNEGIFDWDLVSDRVYVSYRAQELFGLSRGELWRPRRDWRHILTFHPDDAPRLHDRIKAHIEGGAPTYDEEFRIVVPGGGVRWFRQRGIALRDASGKAYRVVGSIGDVTERRQAEEELKAMERKLRQAQRLEAMGTLAGGIAHDFNNILGAILGYGEMALRDAPKGGRLARDLDSIIVAGERGRALVDRVLAFSRSSVGERVPVHVEKVVREALDLISAKLPPDVTLHAKLRAGRAAMLGDSTQVLQVLMNLATNAIQAMPGGGRLRVSLDALRLEVARAPTIGILDRGDYLVLEVSDSGTGVAPDILDRIFDPFFTTKEVGTGTGLGLSLVHGIVAEVGGAIDVASTVGAGSTFTVYFPRSGDAAESQEQSELALPRGDGQRVLVVDDEEPLVKLATRTLEELGYAPVGFTSSAAALAAFRADPQRFDALVTDERMPGMSGSALIREVRGIRERIPIVLMSGYIGGAVATRAREAGAEEVLKKPLSARDLATSLARVLHP